MIVLVIIDIIDVSHIVALIDALSCPLDNQKKWQNSTYLLHVRSSHNFGSKIEIFPFR